MNIVTISREFGSGGRELGRRLADELGYDFYDKEIIDNLIKTKKKDSEGVDQLLQNHGWKKFGLTLRHSLAGIYGSSAALQEQEKMIREIASAGKNCVIVGRNADLLLQDQRPFDIFVCADIDTRIARCREREEGEGLTTDEEFEDMIRSIDENRANARAMLSHIPWGSRSAYDLIVNTAGHEIPDLIPALAFYVKEWFRTAK